MSPAAGAAGKATHPRISPKHRPIPSARRHHRLEAYTNSPGFCPAVAAMGLTDAVKSESVHRDAASAMSRLLPADAEMAA